eukprot:gene2631-2932_t
MYSNANAQPHKVYFGSRSTPVKYGSTTSRYAPPCRACKSTSFYWMDEQNNAVTMSMADKWVKGGGVVHLLTSVLQPSDIFPSARRALVFNNYSALVGALDYVNDSPWGNQMWRQVETVYATYAAPNNAVSSKKLERATWAAD